jgi:hypothetical protein
LAGKQIWRENQLSAKTNLFGRQIWREKTNLREKAILALKQNKFGGNLFSRTTNLARKQIWRDIKQIKELIFQLTNI